MPNDLRAEMEAARIAEGRRRMTHRTPERFENPLTLDHAALALSPVPIAGDVAGFAADAYDWYQHPENRSLGNAIMVGAGVLPFVPPVAAGARVVGNNLMDALEAVPAGSPRAQVGAVGQRGRKILETPSGLRFVPHPHAASGQRTLLVDPEKLDVSWRTDPMYLPRGEVGHGEVPGRREGFQEFLDTGAPIEAARAELIKGEVRFHDGRHRTAVLRDRGAPLVAVTVPRAQAKAFRERFGE